MVLDEDALEAMLNRGREAPEQDRPETIRTDQTEEYEVYERKELAEQAEAEAAQAPPTPEAPPGGDPRQAADHQAPPDAQPSRYVQEPPRDEPPSRPSHEPPAPSTYEERPPAPRTPEPRPPEPPQRELEPEQPREHPEPRPPEPPRQERPHTPSEDHSPPEPQQAFRPEAAGSTTQTRRPQVWPPMHHEADATPAPDPADAGPTEANDAAQEAPDAARTHNPTANTAPTTQTRGDGCRIAVVQALFNQELTDMMADLAVSRARKRGAEVTHHVTVPGVFDLPLMAKRMAEADDVDAVVVIGCVIQGETAHDELITHATAKTLQEVALETGVPIGFGVIGPGMTWDQAEARVVNGKHAVEAALAQWQVLNKA